MAIELRGAGEVDGFERRRVAQLGRLQVRLELALLAGRPLGIDQQAQPLLEAERGGLVGVELLLEGVGHRAELHRVELVERVRSMGHSAAAIEVTSIVQVVESSVPTTATFFPANSLDLSWSLNR